MLAGLTEIPSLETRESRRAVLTQKIKRTGGGGEKKEQKHGRDGDPQIQSPTEEPHVAHTCADEIHRWKDR